MPGRIIFTSRSDGTFADTTVACATQSFDVEYTTKNRTSTLQVGQEVGQSWTAGRDGYLYSIYLERESAGYASSILIRIGQGSDLSSSYLVEYTADVPDTAGFFECVIPAASRPYLTSSVSYTFLFRLNESTTWIMSENFGSQYSGGLQYWDETQDWVGTGYDEWDYTFKTKMCDE